MKKLISRIIVALLFLFSFITPCLADFQPDSSRWIWIDSNDTSGFWYDSKTISVKQENGRNIVSMWILSYNNTPEESVDKTLYNVDVTRKTISFSEIHEYDMQGNIIGSSYYNEFDNTESSVITDTVGEEFYDIANGYISHRM